MNNDTLPAGRILSVQVGKPQSLETAAGKAWKSAIVKTAVTGPVALEGVNLVGDDQSNRRYHGGADKVVCAYASEWFPLWNQEFSLNMPAGAFGENITLQDLTEDKLCIGDTLLIGSEVLLQISQPRQPCINVSKRWAIPSLPRRMEETGHTGFYCRVLRAGSLEAGQTIQVSERPYPRWTLQHANAVMYAEDRDPVAITALRELPLLSAEWKRILGRKLAYTQG
jgi:hypothetical protein